MTGGFDPRSLDPQKIIDLLAARLGMEANLAQEIDSSVTAALVAPSAT